MAAGILILCSFVCTVTVLEILLNRLGVELLRWRRASERSDGSATCRSGCCLACTEVLSGSEWKDTECIIGRERDSVFEFDISASINISISVVPICLQPWVGSVLCGAFSSVSLDSRLERGVSPTGSVSTLAGKRSRLAWPACRIEVEMARPVADAEERVARTRRTSRLSRKAYIFINITFKRSFWSLKRCVCKDSHLTVPGTRCMKRQYRPIPIPRATPPHRTSETLATRDDTKNEGAWPASHCQPPNPRKKRRLQTILSLSRTANRPPPKTQAHKTKTVAFSPAHPTLLIAAQGFARVQKKASRTH